MSTTILAVSDADRAKQFYASLGWREDADFVLGEDLRVLQFTPPGSPGSIIFGTGVKTAVPGTAGSLVLAVDDIDAARAELVGRGVDVSEVRDGSSSFTDPDGNEWLLQEVTTRQVTEPDVAALAGLLLETALHHGDFEKDTPAHDWWDWYAPYLSAREHGSTPAEATEAADRYMQEVRGVARR
jgi:catechol 2,3-dioxygenase-like lactoylglutathione lyase family enzyme